MFHTGKCKFLSIILDLFADLRRMFILHCPMICSDLFKMQGAREPPHVLFARNYTQCIELHSETILVFKNSILTFLDKDQISDDHTQVEYVNPQSSVS